MGEAVSRSSSMSVCVGGGGGCRVWWSISRVRCEKGALSQSEIDVPFNRVSPK